MLEQRKLVHQEVVESEKGYVASLEELVQVRSSNVCEWCFSLLFCVV